MSILKFHDHFDFSELEHHFAELGFIPENYKSANIYHLDADEVLTNSLPGTEHTAILESQKLMVLSPSPDLSKEVVDTILGTHASAQGNTLITSLVDDWQNPLVALVDFSPAVCESQSLEALVPDEQEQKEVKESYDLSSLQPYEALGLAYTFESKNFIKTPVAVFSLSFSTEQAAEADLVPRQALMETGFSLLTEQPISDVLFQLDSAEVSGQHLLFRGSPAHEVRRLLQMIYNRDLLFAVCP